MRAFFKSHDGGPDSGVTGYWLFECKWLFSIVVLRFSKGSREAYHNHAFNALTWWLSGSVTEEHLDGRKLRWKASIRPKYTPRGCFHRIVADDTTWALSFRGPWLSYWNEFRRGKMLTLGHGRKVISAV